MCYFSASYIFFVYLCIMKKCAFATILLIITTMCCGQQVVVDSAWRSDIKTVILSTTASDLEEPLIAMDNVTHKLSLQFDILADEPEALRWSISHCDADWHVDNLEPYEFLQGFEYGPIDNYDFSFTTLTPFIHYHQTVPANGATFIHSGNYILTVSIEDNPDSILITKRFRVTEQAVKVGIETALPYDGIATDRRQEVDVSIEPLPSTFGITLNQQYLKVIARQNGRLDNQRELVFSGYNGNALSYRNRPQNIFDGGNSFRFFDLSNMRTQMYNVQRVERYGGETFAIIAPCENRSRRHYTSDAALSGGMKINVFDRQNKTLEADYVWVNISLPMESPMLGGSIHVVGALTDWRLDDGSRMDYNPEFKAYTKRLLLKQGYYAYQLLYLPARSNVAETAMLEGDHHETPNTYNVSVYYRSPGDRADRLLAVRTIIANK